MSFWKKLFGGGNAKAEAEKPKAALEYKGYTIEARPFREDGQWQLAGRVSKQTEAGLLSHEFIRADRFSDIKDAEQIALNKGKQLVDQLGERLFPNAP